jgi:hypothetical protein
MTHLTYGSEPDVTYAWVDSASVAVTSQLPHVKLVRPAWIVGIPRYQEFTAVASELAAQGVQFVDIAGNAQILVSLLAPQDWRYAGDDAQLLFSTPILTDPNRQRMVMRCDVPKLVRVLNALAGSGAIVEHVYDY